MRYLPRGDVVHGGALEEVAAERAAVGDHDDLLELVGASQFAVFPAPAGVEHPANLEHPAAAVLVVDAHRVDFWWAGHGGQPQLGELAGVGADQPELAAGA